MEKVCPTAPTNRLVGAVGRNQNAWGSLGPKKMFGEVRGTR